MCTVYCSKKALFPHQASDQMFSILGIIFFIALITLSQKSTISSAGDKCTSFSQIPPDFVLFVKLNKTGVLSIIFLKLWIFNMGQIIMKILYMSTSRMSIHGRILHHGTSEFAQNTSFEFTLALIRHSVQEAHRRLLVKPHGTVLHLERNHPTC